MKTLTTSFALAASLSLFMGASAAQPDDETGEPADVEPEEEEMAPVTDEAAEPPPPTPAPGPAPVPVQAPPPGGGGFGFEAPLDHHAHLGFFGRVMLGFGYQQMTEEVQGNDLKVSGASGAFFLSLGYSVAPRLAVHVNLGGVSIVGPTVELNGMEAETSDDVTATTAGIGVGATYYLPSNMFFGGSLMFGSVSLADGDEEIAESDTGVALTFEGGKEWWVGSNVGVGVLAQLMVGAFPDGGDGVDATLGTASFTINLSATYN